MPASQGQTRNQLEKALFAEEVEQDHAKAAAIYQAMIADSGELPRYLAMARFRLATIQWKAGKHAEADALLKALASDPNAPADWVVQAERMLAERVGSDRTTFQRNAAGPSSELYEILKDKLWYWHSGNGEPFGALRFHPEGKLETTLGTDWLAGWMPIGANRIRIRKPEGKYWVIELSDDGRESKGIAEPGAVDPFKFIRIHPVPSTSIEDADIEFLKKLLEKQPDSIAAQKIPCRLAKQNRTKALAFLFDHGIHVDLRELDSCNFTPLMYAVEYGEVGTVRFLLDRGADVNALDSRGVSPLFIAAWGGRSEVVGMLLDRGADIESSSPELRNNDQRLELGTALHGAVQQGHSEVARLLLKRGADINAVTQTKEQTPLVAALAMRNYAIAAELLNSGANPNLPASGIENPLRQAAYQGDLSMVRLLLSKGAKPDIQSDAMFKPFGLTRTVGSALEVAAREGHSHVVGALIDAGCRIEHQTPRYMETPLHAAALHGNTVMCRWLLDRGASIDHRLADKIGIQSGWRPLHSASWRESPEVVRLLIEKGASPADACHEAGMMRSPFHLAVLKGNLVIAKMMMDHMAANGREKMVELLKQPDSKGNSALHLAVSSEAKPNAGLVRFLIASGASMEATNQSNLTPRQLCLDPELGSRDPAVRMVMGN